RHDDGGVAGEESEQAAVRRPDGARVCREIVAPAQGPARVVDRGPGCTVEREQTLGRPRDAVLDPAVAPQEQERLLPRADEPELAGEVAARHHGEGCAVRLPRELRKAPGAVYRWHGEAESPEAVAMDPDLVERGRTAALAEKRDAPTVRG